MTTTLNSKIVFRIMLNSLEKQVGYTLTLMVNALHLQAHGKQYTHAAGNYLRHIKFFWGCIEYSGDQYLRSVIYTNVSSALQFSSKEYEWTENYIKEYSSKLPPEHTVNMMYYSMAYLSFAKRI